MHEMLRGKRHKKSPPFYDQTMMLIEKRDMVASAITEMIEEIDMLRKIKSCRMRSYIASMVRNDSIDYVRKRDRQGKYAFLTDDDEMMNRIPAEGSVDDHIFLSIPKWTLIRL